MMRSALSILWMTVVCLSAPTHAQRASGNLSAGANRDLITSSQIPLQTELIAPLNLAKLTRGASVLAKAKVDWNDPACHLRVGSVIVGHVIDFELRSNQNKGSSLTLAFDHAECDDHNTPFPFILFAIQIQEWSPTNQPIDLFGSGSRPVGGMGGTTTAPSVAGGARIDMRQESGLRNNQSNGKTPSVITSGQVIGSNKITLSVGTGPDGASVLSSSKDNIRLEKATQLILIPGRIPTRAPEPVLTASTAQPTLPATAPAPAPRLTPPPTPQPLPLPEVDETSVCTAPCSLVPTDVDLTPSKASLTLATRSLGYTPHELGDRAVFGFESTLSYLDANNILFTYDPHHLRLRVPSGFRTETMRTIRAVLLDPATLHVKRILDWQIQGEGQYIWHVGSGKILVHLGHNLRLLGPDLAVLRQIPLPGQLAFVSTSPSGNRVVVGVLHERHTRPMHNDLVEATSTEPEEDVDVQLFDQDLSPLLTSRQSSRSTPPVLSEAGEIRVNSAGTNRWRLREIRWDRTEHTIATLTSGCSPKLATPMPNSVFVIGCASPLESWYRMIRLDGHLILNGPSSSHDMELASSSNQNEFAVRVVRAQKTKSRGQHFRKRTSKSRRSASTAQPTASVSSSPRTPPSPSPSNPSPYPPPAIR